MKYNLEATTSELALTVARHEVAPRILHQVSIATMGSHMSVIEFDDTLAPNGSLTYFNSFVGDIKILSLTLEIPHLGILIKLDDEDVSEFLEGIGPEDLLDAKV